MYSHLIKTFLTPDFFSFFFRLLLRIQANSPKAEPWPLLDRRNKKKTFTFELLSRSIRWLDSLRKWWNFQPNTSAIKQATVGFCLIVTCFCLIGKQLWVTLKGLLPHFVTSQRALTFSWRLSLGCAGVLAGNMRFLEICGDSSESWVDEKMGGTLEI